MYPILAFLPKGYIFETAELRAMGEAFDHAMALTPTVNRNGIAAAIFSACQSGQRDPTILCEMALRASATPEELRYLRSM